MWGNTSGPGQTSSSYKRQATQQNGSTCSSQWPGSGYAAILHGGPLGNVKCVQHPNLASLKSEWLEVAAAVWKLQEGSQAQGLGYSPEGGRPLDDMLYTAVSKAILPFLHLWTFLSLFFFSSDSNYSFDHCKPVTIPDRLRAEPARMTVKAATKRSLNNCILLQPILRFLPNSQLQKWQVTEHHQTG